MRTRISPVLTILGVSLLAGGTALSQPAKQPPSAKPAAAPSSTPSAAPSATAAPAAQDGAPSKEEEARQHFSSGLALFDAEKWDGALAEFLRSREIMPRPSTTKNAAICLRRLNRNDEALEMFEALLAFKELPKAEKELAEREVAALAGLIGTIDVKGAESGSSIVIDGRDRGTYPVPSALRVGVGTHVVRVYKDGFEAFETRVEVAGREEKTVSVKMHPLSQAGRITVVEQKGLALDVVIDNVVVGKTPWEGALATGDHVVFLRGGDLGTQPAAVPVKINQVTPLTLAAEPLSAALRVEPTPAGATIALDGVSLGHGLWEGQLRAGSHRVEITAEGFVPVVRDVTLAKEKREVLTVTLERDPTSSMWRDSRGRFFAEVDAGFGITPSFSGEVAASCKGDCSASPGMGFLAVGRGGYRFPSGFMLGIDAGYLLLSQSLSNRATTVTPKGLAANPGAADDAFRLQGAVVGAFAGIRIGDRFPLTFRLGAGVLLGTVSDRRTGTFTTVARANVPAAKYDVSVGETPSLNALSLTPEARLGFKVGDHLELSVGAEAMVLIAFSQPAWDPDKGKVLAATDGEGRFGAETLTGKVMVAVVPGLGARYEF